VITSYRNLTHSSIPEGLYAGISMLPAPKKEHAALEHSVESLSGRKLLKMLISDRYESSKPRFTTIKYEKPSARVNGDVISVSFSHTTQSVAAVISKRWVVGVDMESSKRTVNDRLAKRMKHENESLKLYENNPIIKIWTMKEAALKAIGTGLRQPMNSVHLKSVSEHLCAVHFNNNTKAEIASFQQQNQWISICYIRPELTQSYLSEDYVPIQTGRD